MDVEIPYCGKDPDGMTPFKMCKLSVEIWEESLLRGPWKTMFDTFWDNYRCAKCSGNPFSGKGHDVLVQEMAKLQVDSGSPPGTCTADSGYVSEERQESAKIKFEDIAGL
jgi:hypothetical protein